MRAAVFIAVALAVAVAAKHVPHHTKDNVLPPLPNFTGFIVTAQWDGRTVPTVQWALDVTRQDVEFRPKQELKLQKLIPTTPGNALTPTYTAYDSGSRQYFTTVERANGTASLFGMTIANDVGSSTPMSPVEVRYQYDSLYSRLVGLEAWNNAGVVTVLVLFQDGTVLAVDPATGATTPFATLITASQKLVLTTAITLDNANDMLYCIVQTPTVPVSMRQVLSLNLLTGTITLATIQKLANFDPTVVHPFEMQYLPGLKNLLIFYGGNFDQLVYTDPSSGMTSFAVESLMDYNLEFYFDDFLEDDDTWSNSAYDSRHNYVYFQCSEVSPSDDMTTTALCRVNIAATDKNWLIPQVCISPMTYGYAGMQFVQVV